MSRCKLGMGIGFDPGKIDLIPAVRHGGHGMVGVPTLVPKISRRKPSFNNTSDWYTAPPRPNHDSQPKGQPGLGRKVSRARAEGTGT